LFKFKLRSSVLPTLFQGKYSVINYTSVAINRVIIVVIGMVSGGQTIPTQAQLLQCYTLSCWATRCYLPINLIRFDERTGNIFLLISEEIEIDIKPNGKWIK